ncbi:unnamed protein product [Sphenostylis stenocarpa]|uniref:Late embryogenesis abundant protein LEA-2 subgroup domain-containing protein n=1 Tax=Sphenostylis stenocarpa TaxID=92480 RepID=A0AA86SUH3_9FABA|nr:unnamed protein product [Sphenostylis stenocarpa]
MADRVHPRNSPLSQPKPSPSAAQPVGPYVVKVPKQLLPSESYRRYSHYNRRETRRCSCCSFLCWLISILFVLTVLLGAAAGVFYLFFRPEAPVYAIEHIAVKGVNLTSVAFSPEFDVSVRAYNGNDKIGICYEEGSSFAILYNDARLCDGTLPSFYQPSNNVTVFEAMLTGHDVKLAAWDQRALVKNVATRSVPLMLELRVPVKIKVGYVSTWKITVRVNCDMTLDQLTEQARIVKRGCSYRVDPW